MAKASGGSKAARYDAGCSDADLVHAVAHPLRRVILRALNSSRGPLSPQEIEDLLGLAAVRKRELSSVAYHMRELARRGAASLVTEVPVRGASKHLYASSVCEVAWVRDLLGRTQKSDQAQLRPKGRPQRDDAR